MANVTLRDVNKSYDKIPIIQDVSLAISDREFIVLVGPSGCGKTTLLRMIAGLEDITAGEISIDDTVVNDVSPKDRDIAMVFQNYALYPHMTVYDNMAFGLKMRKTPKNLIQEKVKATAEILDLSQLLKRKPKQLSGGQRQRVALGRAIVRNPKVFLMDEPLSNLDAKLRVQMRRELITLHKSLNATTIYVTHDRIEAMTMGDRIVILNQGKIQQVDTPLNTYRDPNNKFVADFVGHLNTVSGILEDLDNQPVLKSEGGIVIHLPENFKDFTKNNTGKLVLIGFRPEHLTPDLNRLVRENIPFQPLMITPYHTEQLGNETHIHGYFGDTVSWISRATNTEDVDGNTENGPWNPCHDDDVETPRSQLKLGLQINQILLFDGSTEQRIRV
ncbi:MAG: sn-glycerol-3-phosphate ABC transporter ATP-binding protein UgpC [Cyanobacteria bacterium P01_H01_bin.74]